jgi:RHS repeat-associated protein
MISPSCSYRNDSLPEYCIGDYRFGFNGMESEGTVYGEGNTYDFGARMYDGRIGRWMSTDPISQVHESSYSYVSGNPIIYFDQGGEDNIVYLVRLASAEAVISKEQAEAIKDLCNSKLSALGSKTRVVVFESHEPFDPRHMDATDSYVFLGSKEEISTTIESNKSAFSGRYPEDYKELNDFNHPEESNMPGAGIVINSNALIPWAKAVKGNIIESTVQIILHGMGHNSNERHLNTDWISMEAADILKAINPENTYLKENMKISIAKEDKIKNIDDVSLPELNKSFAKDLEKHFETNTPVDNYDKNKFRKLNEQKMDKHYGDQKNKFDN